MGVKMTTKTGKFSIAKNGLLDKHQDTEELCESKGSRTVLETSGAGDSFAEFTYWHTHPSRKIAS